MRKKKVVTVVKDTPIEKVCRILTRNNLSGVPVVDGKGGLAGFISERDIIANFNAKCFSFKAKDIMKKNVISIKEGTPPNIASKIFAEKAFRHLPVLKKGKVVDVISRKDVIKKIVEHYY